MNVELLNYTPLWVAARAIRTCWASEGLSDTPLEGEGLLEPICGPKDRALIDRVGNKYKHASTLEHLIMTWELTGIISLKEQSIITMFKEDNFSVVTKSNTEFVITANVRALQQLTLQQEYLNKLLPESYKYLFDLSEH